MTPEMEAAYQALLRLSPDERFTVLASFCPYCGNHTPRGPDYKPCPCERDE